MHYSDFLEFSEKELKGASMTTSFDIPKSFNGLAHRLCIREGEFLFRGVRSYQTFDQMRLQMAYDAPEKRKALLEKVDC